MKSIGLLVILLSLLISCAPRSESGPQYMLEKATDWQEREGADYSGTLPLNWENITDVASDLASRYTYVSDEDQFVAEDYWQTDTEVWGSMMGDCEDWAIIVYTTLSEIGYAQDFLGIIVFINGDTSHIEPAIFPDGRGEIDSMLLVHQDGTIDGEYSGFGEPSCGFDFQDFWTY